MLRQCGCLYDICIATPIFDQCFFFLGGNVSSYFVHGCNPPVSTCHLYAYVVKFFSKEKTISLEMQVFLDFCPLLLQNWKRLFHEQEVLNSTGVIPVAFLKNLEK